MKNGLLILFKAKICNIRQFTDFIDGFDVGQIQPNTVIQSIHKIQLGIYSEMGQCMQIQYTSTLFHPRLGFLDHFVKQGKGTFVLKLPIQSEEDYMAWSKIINKMRYSDIKKYAYLPTNEIFKSGGEFCSSSHMLQLTFQSYSQTLRQNIVKNTLIKYEYTQSEIWYFVYVMAKYIKYFDKNREDLKNITFDHILICENGLKIIPQAIIPSIDPNDKVLILDQEWKSENRKSILTVQHYHPIIVVGIMVLCLAGLHQPDQFFNFKTKNWVRLTPEFIKNYLTGIKNKFSDLLFQTINQMLTYNQKKFDLATLLQRLEIFNSQINCIPQVGFKFGDSTAVNSKCHFQIEELSIKGSNIRLSQLQSQENYLTNINENNENNENNVKTTTFRHNKEEYLNIL